MVEADGATFFLPNGSTLYPAMPFWSIRMGLAVGGEPQLLIVLHLISYLVNIILTLSQPVPVILILLKAWLGSDKYQFLSHWFDSTRVRTHGFESPDLPYQMRDGRSTHSAIPSGQWALVWVIFTTGLNFCRMPFCLGSIYLASSCSCVFVPGAVIMWASVWTLLFRGVS